MRSRLPPCERSHEFAGWWGSSGQVAPTLDRVSARIPSTGGRAAVSLPQDVGLSRLPGFGPTRILRQQAPNEAAACPDRQRQRTAAGRHRLCSLLVAGLLVLWPTIP